MSKIQSDGVSEQLLQVIDKEHVEPATRENLMTAFSPFFKEAKVLVEQAKEIVVTDVEQFEEIEKAKALRMQLRTIRLSADKKRKELKEDSLRYGKAVQGIYNVIDYLTAPAETYLKEQEEFEAIQRKKRWEVLNEQRQEECSALKEFIPSTLLLGNLTEDEYNTLLAGWKSQKQIQVQKRLEEERLEREAKQKLEDERLEREARQKEEYDRLKKEKEEQEQVLLEERKEREKKEQEYRLEQERLKKESEEQERLLAEERKRNEEALAEIRRKEEEERLKEEKAKKIEEERIRKEEERREKEKREAEEKEKKRIANAPDKEKLIRFLSDLSLLQLPSVTGEETKKITLHLRKEMARIISEVTLMVNNL